MTDRIRRIADIILEIERSMRLLGRWSEQIPSQEQLASTQPFAIDTLNFDQWLQFVFLPRMKVIIEHGGGLPSQSQIGPMAEEYYAAKVSSSPDMSSLVEAIKEFDQRINCA